MKVFVGPFLSVWILILGCTSGTNQSVSKNEWSEEIRVNQIGYYPNAIKKAVIVNQTEGTIFQVLEGEDRKVIYEGKLSDAQEWPLAGEKICVADFSEIEKEGTYRIEVKGVGFSYPFEIKKQVLDEVKMASLKALYYQRMSMPLEEKYAGKWQRQMAHADDNILYHESSGKSGKAKPSPKGWYDAGDYNKYVVNGSFSLGQILLLQEQYPNAFDDRNLNIPETVNGQSDLLDEMKYEMDWLLTMQDEDGGMFHKLTTKKFEPMAMPDMVKGQRYIVGKGTGATLDFAAAAAQAYRVFQDTKPLYAELCLSASQRAYQWAVKNPKVEYTNPKDIRTGEYGDDDFKDEWYWANAELYLSTKEDKYFEKIKGHSFDIEYRAGEGWTEFMRFTGAFSLLQNKAAIPEATYVKLKKDILYTADVILSKSRNGAYFQPVKDFRWGSNSDLLNAGIILAQAYRLSHQKEYLVGVQQIADYILGNNALGYSFITGHGDRTPMFIHHRQSAADAIEEPVPGLLSGGPNSRMQDVKDGTKYPSNSPPMKCWVDQESSYASNEICLNWNAPLIYILGFLEEESN